MSLSHRMSNTAEYRIWCAMKCRCNNPNATSFKNHGARGISICEKWNNSFEEFYKDMGKRPSPSHSIDRIDNNGNYEPVNCRWATPAQQTRNTRLTVFATLNGITKPATDWCSELGFNRETVQYRLRNGWTAEEALSIRPSFRNWMRKKTKIKV